MVEHAIIHAITSLIHASSKHKYISPRTSKHKSSQNDKQLAVLWLGSKQSPDLLMAQLPGADNEQWSPEILDTTSTEILSALDHLDDVGSFNHLLTLPNPNTCKQVVKQLYHPQHDCSSRVQAKLAHAWLWT